MIDTVKDAVVPMVIRAALVVATLSLWWIAVVVVGSLTVLIAYAASAAPLFLTLFDNMAFLAVVPMLAYGAYRLIEDGLPVR